MERKAEHEMATAFIWWLVGLLLMCTIILGILGFGGLGFI